MGHYAPFHTPDAILECDETSRPSGMSVDDMEFFDDKGNELPPRKEAPQGSCSIEGWQDRGLPILSVYDADGEVMSGHNDIFNRKLQALIWRFVRDVDMPPLYDAEALEALRVEPSEAVERGEAPEPDPTPASDPTGPPGEPRSDPASPSDRP